MSVYASLKKLWKKLGLKGKVKNFSDTEIWVLDNDAGVVGRKLLPGYKTPIKIDTDAFKRVDGVAIEGHKNWWKIYDGTTAEIYNANKSIEISAITKTAVSERYFGKPQYKDEPWGEPIRLITAVKRNKKKKITSYFVTRLGWISPERALKMTCRHEIDNARPVFSKAGAAFIRTRRDQELFNNISVKG